MRHALAQRCIDAGLPALPGGLEGFDHIGIHSHIQGRPLNGGYGPARPRLILACCQYAATATESLGS